MSDFLSTALINGNVSNWDSLLSLWDLIFRHPSVRCLSVSDMESLSDIPEPVRVSNRASTSNVISLSLPHWQVWDTKVNTLEEILSWPAALQNFHISLALGEMTIVNLNTKHIIKALTSQRKSLRALSIDFLNFKPETRIKQSLGLEKFPVLKTLGLPYHELASCHSSLKRYWHILPPSLEVLQLQYEPALESPPSSPEPESSVPPVAGSDFVRRMLELLGHIKVECPRLREVVIWYSMSSRIKKRFYPDEFEKEGLVSAFDGAGILIYGWVQMDPPPFDPI
jgi:hypothetical protein